jgi:hypothetical protein
MSMSDARMFADLTARVTALEEHVRELTERSTELGDRVFGKDVHEEVMGPPPDMAARDGLRTLLKEQATRVLQEGKPATGGSPKPPEGGKPPEGEVASSVDVKPEAAAEDLASDPVLKDRLAALQGGEAAKPAAPKK